MKPTLLQKRMNEDARTYLEFYTDPDKPKAQITSDLEGMCAFAQWQDRMICEGGWKIEWVNVWYMDIQQKNAPFNKPKGSCLVTKYRHTPSGKIRWFFLEQTGRLVGYEANRGKLWEVFEDTDAPKTLVIRIG